MRSASRRAIRCARLHGLEPVAERPAELVPSGPRCEPFGRRMTTAPTDANSPRTPADASPGGNPHFPQFRTSIPHLASAANPHGCSNSALPHFPHLHLQGAESATRIERATSARLTGAAGLSDAACRCHRARWPAWRPLKISGPSWSVAAAGSMTANFKYSPSVKGGYIRRAVDMPQRIGAGPAPGAPWPSWRPPAPGAPWPSWRPPAPGAPCPSWRPPAPGAPARAGDRLRLVAHAEPDAGLHLVARPADDDWPRRGRGV
jgi:hypothetical protein